MTQSPTTQLAELNFLDFLEYQTLFLSAIISVTNLCKKLVCTDNMAAGFVSLHISSEAHVIDPTVILAKRALIRP